MGITTLSDLIELLKTTKETYQTPLWYRGQAKHDWALSPKLYRGSSMSEAYYIARFKQDATMLLAQHPKTEFDWLFLMQHYGFPTRLLDWSENPLVALFFAVSEEVYKDSDAAFWILFPTILNKESRYRAQHPFEIPSFDDEFLFNYLPSRVSSAPTYSYLPMAAIAPRNSVRMQSQQGVFTISHENKAIDEIEEERCVLKFTIPHAAKQTIKEELEILSFTRFSIFPELESLSYKL